MESGTRVGGRVYWLTEEFYPPQIGGLELTVSTLSHGLTRHGCEVTVVTRQTDPPCASRERIDDLIVRRIRPAGQSKGLGWHAVPVMLLYILRLAFLLLREAGRYDVLLVSGMKVIPLVAIPLSRVLRKRCIIRLESTCEIMEPISESSANAIGRRTGRGLSFLLGRIQRWIVCRADCIIAPSRQLAGALAQLGVPASLVREIPNAIDLRRFHPVSASERAQLRAQLGLPDVTLVLFVGRLSRAKGIELLVDAWPDIAARHADLCLVIIGSGDESFDNCDREVRDSIRRSKLGAERVRMMGSRSDVHRFLQAADLYILPSHYEGFGVGTIEALACAVPVLVTPVGVAPQLIRDRENGFLFPVDDRDAMLGTIEAALAARGSWPQIGARARAAVALMDVDSVIAQYVALIGELAASADARHSGPLPF